MSAFIIYSVYTFILIRICMYACVLYKFRHRQQFSAQNLDILTYCHRINSKLVTILSTSMNIVFARLALS